MVTDQGSNFVKCFKQNKDKSNNQIEFILNNVANLDIEANLNNDENLNDEAVFKEIQNLSKATK